MASRFRHCDPYLHFSHLFSCKPLIISCQGRFHTCGSVVTQFGELSPWFSSWFMCTVQIHKYTLSGVHSLVLATIFLSLWVELVKVISHQRVKRSVQQSVGHTHLKSESRELLAANSVSDHSSADINVVLFVRGM